jgi:hypothetical protein
LRVLVRRLITLFPVVALLVAGCGGSNDDSTASTATPAGFNRLLGSWTGEVHQAGLAPFRVVVGITSPTDPLPNPVHYSGIDCAGNWTYLGRAGIGYRFREVIDRGAGGNCKGVGEVLVTPDAGVLDYEFKGGGIESQATLFRTNHGPVITLPGGEQTK